MNHRHLGCRALGILGCLLFGGCAEKAPPVSPEIQAMPYAVPKAFTEKDLARFKPVSVGIRRATALTLYEGLPHPVWEAESLKKELTSGKKIMRAQGFPFYARPLPLRAAAVERLRVLCADEASYTTYQGPKMCGGYHPDHCLVWQDGEVTYQLLVCFGCHEMKIFGPAGEIMADIRPKAFEAFESALKEHRVQRPPRQE